MTDHLEGVRVVEFGHYIAGPAAGAHLAALGADVVKVEPPGGEACRHLGIFGTGMLNATNAGKRSICLDLRRPAGIEVARQLISRCDVVIHNMRPGGMDAYGLGYADARELNPAVIYASISGFGTAGPSQDRPGLDIAAQAESGMMWTVGEEDGDPLRVTPPIVDAATAHVLAQAILAALFRRLRTGRGQRIDISLLEVAIHLQSTGFHEFVNGAPEPRRRGNGQANAAPAADLIRTRDGYFVLSAYTQEAWSTLTRMIGRPEIAADPRFTTLEGRVFHRGALLEALNAAFAEWGTEDAVTWLNDHRIVAGAVRRYPDVLDAPDVVASGLITSGDAPSDFSIGSPYSFDGERPRGSSPVPPPGLHSREVLGELGYDRTQIDGLLAEGAVHA